MSAVTISRPGEWDALLPATRGISHRSTTSSRHPGKAIEGNVSYDLHRLITCPLCGGLRRASLHPHAPRWLGAKRVDCTGTEVAP